MVTQTVLLRELLSLAGGNELTLGIALGAWMLLTGWGAWIGQRLPARARGGGLALGLAAMGALPAATLIALREGWTTHVGRGVAAGMSEVAGAALVAFAPFCLASGAFLALAARPAASDAEGEPSRGVGRVYALDCLGGVLGGALFTFFLVRLLAPVPLLATVGAAVGVTAICVGFGCAAEASGAGRKLARAAPGLLAVGLCVVAAGWLRSSGERERHDTPYGVIEIASDGGQVAVFMDGRPVSSSANVERAEEAVHPVLAQRPKAERVLLIGGSTSGMVKEILRYPVRQLDCFELDRSLGEAAARHGFLPRNDPRVRVRIGDGREFVKRVRGEYDAILVEVPEPSSFQWNRYFTREFFAEAKRALRPRGVLAVAAGEYDNYVSPELARIVGTVSSDLTGVFAHVMVLPTSRIRYLGSDGPMSADVPARVAASGLLMRHLNAAGLRAVFSGERMAQVHGARRLDERENRDFHPVLCERFFRDWMKRFRPVPSALALAAVAVLLVGVALVRQPSFPVFASGYAGATAQILVLVGFQALFGSVYGKVGWLTAVFFAGLGIGAVWGGRVRRGSSRMALLLLVLLLLALPTCLGLMGQGGGGTERLAEWFGVPMLAFVPAILAGAVLPLSAREGKAEAGDLYHADFAGGCLGALLVSGLLLPWLGLAAAAFVAAGVCLVGAALAATGEARETCS